MLPGSQTEKHERTSNRPANEGQCLTSAIRTSARPFRRGARTSPFHSFGRDSCAQRARVPIKILVGTRARNGAAANRATSQPAGQPTNQPAIQPANKPGNQSANKPISQLPSSQATNQPISQPISQAVNQPASQPGQRNQSTRNGGPKV